MFFVCVFALNIYFYFEVFPFHKQLQTNLCFSCFYSYIYIYLIVAKNIDKDAEFVSASETNDSTGMKQFLPESNNESLVWTVGDLNSARSPLRTYGRWLKQILSMKFSGFMPNVGAVVAKHRNRDEPTDAGAICFVWLQRESNTGFIWDYQWEGIKVKAENPKSLSLIGWLITFLICIIHNYYVDYLQWNY